MEATEATTLNGCHSRHTAFAVCSRAQRVAEDGDSRVAQPQPVAVPADHKILVTSEDNSFQTRIHAVTENISVRGNAGYTAREKYVLTPPRV